MRTRILAILTSIAIGTVGLVAVAPPASAATDCQVACSFDFAQPSNLGTNGPFEMGVQFSADISGLINAICSYRPPGESGDHRVTLWDASGSPLATASSPGTPGAQNCTTLAPAVPITANTTYTASYSVTTDLYWESGQFAAPIDAGHLHAPARGGVFVNVAGTFPTNSYGDGDGYGADVRFVTPPEGVNAQPIGDWKNSSSCTGGKHEPKLDQTLLAAGSTSVGDLTLTGSDCVKAVRILDKSTIDTNKKQASDPLFNLAAQLLAAKLNYQAGAQTCVDQTLTDAQALLVKYHFDGKAFKAGTYQTKVTAADAQRANSLGKTLDTYNHNLTVC